MGDFSSSALGTYSGFPGFTGGSFEPEVAGGAGVAFLSPPSRLHARDGVT